MVECFWGERVSTSDVMNDGRQRRTDGKTSLVDAEITTVKVDRRSFLTKATVAGSLALGAVLSTSCGADKCDSDISRDMDDRGFDDTAVEDPPGGDTCDAD